MVFDINTIIGDLLSEEYHQYSTDEPPTNRRYDRCSSGPESVCPSCSGPSATAGPCAACLAIEADDSAPPGPATDRLPPDHHIYPQEFRDRFGESGITNIDDFTVTMYEFQHELLHSTGWNADWDMFFQSTDAGGVVATPAEIEDFGRYLTEKYGFPEAVWHAYKDKSGELGPYI